MRPRASVQFQVGLLMVSLEEAPVPPRVAQHHAAQQEEPMTVGLWLIIALKGITGLLLWGAFVLLLIAQRENPRDFFSDLIFRTFRGNPPDLAIRFFVSNTEF